MPNFKFIFSSCVCYPKDLMWNRVKKRLALIRIYGSLFNSLPGLSFSVRPMTQASGSKDQVVIG